MQSSALGTLQMASTVSFPPQMTLAFALPDISSRALWPLGKEMKAFCLFSSANSGLFSTVFMPLRAASVMSELLSEILTMLGLPASSEVIHE